MGETPGPGRLRALAGRVRTVPRTRLTAGAAVVALAVSVPFGGLRQSYAETHPAVDAQAGRLLHADPLEVTFTGASVVDALRSYRSDGTTSTVVGPSEEGGSLLILKATVVNTSDRSVGSILLRVGSLKRDASPTGKLLYARVAGVSELGTTSVRSLDDASYVAKLSPGVTYHLAIAVDLGRAPLPSEVALGVARLSHDPLAYSPDVLDWQHPEPAYQLTLPVADRRGDKQRPPGWQPADPGSGA